MNGTYWQRGRTHDLVWRYVAEEALSKCGGALWRHLAGAQQDHSTVRRSTQPAL